MPSVQRLLDERVARAMRDAFPEAADLPAIVVASQDPRFGDYQANGAMALAKRLKRKPREVAEAILAHLDISDLAEKPEIAGPGFINMRLRPDWVAQEIGKVNRIEPGQPEDRLGVPRAERPETVVVDYSAPNIAKEMHVGHLRSTIIGDALALMLDLAGRRVIRQNHFGDWGTQFGTVILGMWHMCMAEKPGHASLRELLKQLAEVSALDSVENRKEALTIICNVHQEDLDDDPDGKKHFDKWLQRHETAEDLTLPDIEEGYRFVTKVEDLAEDTGLTITHKRAEDITHNRAEDRHPEDCPLSKVSGRTTSMMQKGGPKNAQEFRAWRLSRDISLRHCNQVYAHLGVLLEDADIRGESAYNDDLPKVVEELRAKGLLIESAGAQCLFLKDADGKPLFVAKDGSPLPFIVQKSDEGYLYATTDLAAIRYRVGELHANRILYVVDARQSLHFQMLFACARKSGFAPPDVALVHVAFGTMMGPDGRPFKTREGGTVKLMDLLDEAEKRAYELVTRKNEEDVAAGRAQSLAENERRDIARKVGIGAVKYADLSQSRTSDYVFSWDKMLSLDGNTAPYMQYAYARVRSIFRKGGHEAEEHRGDAAPIAVDAPAELALAKMILRFPEAIDRTLEDYRPNVLAAYLYDLAQAFTAFYDACPVIQSEEPTRANRLKLCDLTARVIHRGLYLLGIETAERM